MASENLSDFSTLNPQAELQALKENGDVSTASTEPTTTTAAESKAVSNGEVSLPSAVSRVREALGPLHLTEKQKREAWIAWKENPAGAERMAYESMNAVRPAAAFLRRIREGLHLEPERKRVRYTGWRWVKGTHSGTYVRDPKGVDVLPPRYGLGESVPPTPEPERLPLEDGV